jgi:hypothetical protein
MKPFPLSRRNIVLLTLILSFFCLAHRLAFMDQPKTGGDSFRYWHAAQRILEGLPYNNNVHHTARFAIVLPMALFQAVFGESLLGYAIPSVFLSWMITLGLAWLGYVMQGPLTGLLAALFYVFFPASLYDASRPMDGVFASAYLIGIVYCLLRSHADLARKTLWTVAATLFFFLLYMTKISNLFFLPGLLACIWYLHRELRLVALSASILGALFGLETAAYLAFTDYNSRIHLISTTYGKTGKLRPIPFLRLFYRFGKLDWPWHLGLVSAVAGAVQAFRAKRHAHLVPALLAASYLVIITFYVKSINPVIPGMLFHPRYLSPVIPLILLGSALWIFGPWSPLRRGDEAFARALARPLAGSFLMALALLFGIGGFALIRTSVAREQHPFNVLTNAPKALKQAHAEGLPVLLRSYKKPSGDRYPRLGVLRFLCSECRFNSYPTRVGKTDYFMMLSANFMPPSEAPCRYLLVEDPKNHRISHRLIDDCGRASREVAPQSAHRYAGASSWQAKSWPYGVGEKIAWKLRWGLIEAAELRAEVLPPEALEGHPALRLRGSLKGSKALEYLYKIDNRFEAWLSTDRHLPLRHEIEQAESKRRGHRVVTFNQAKLRSRSFEDLRMPDGKNQVSDRGGNVAPGAQDIFGALYFYRFVPPARDFQFTVHDRSKNWLVEFRYLGKETVQVPAGRFDTLRYSVRPRPFGTREPRGELEVWLRSDDTRVLVQFKAKIPLGSVTGELVDYEAGRPLNLAPPSFAAGLGPEKL